MCACLANLNGHLPFALFLRISRRPGRRDPNDFSMRRPEHGPVLMHASIRKRCRSVPARIPGPSTELLVYDLGCAFVAFRPRVLGSPGDHRRSWLTNGMLENSSVLSFLSHAFVVLSWSLEMLVELSMSLCCRFLAQVDRRRVETTSEQPWLLLAPAPGF